MACVAIGEANPEIAGIGILVAFTTQSLIAVFVSIYTSVLTVVISIGRSGGGDGSLLQLVAKKLKMKRLFRTGTRSTMLVVRLASWVLGEGGEGAGMLTATLKRYEFANRILIAGNDSQTFTGIALLISALAQTKTLSLYHMHILYDTISLVVISNCAASMSIFSQGILKGYIRLSLIATWTALFISYSAVFVARLNKWDDNMPRHCYQTANVSRPGAPRPLVDKIYVSITLACTLATLAYAAVYALSSKSRHAGTYPAAAAAGSEEIQRRIVALLSKQSVSREMAKAEFQDLVRLYWQSATVDKQDALVRIALLQCPLHIYSIFALRSANERFLDEGGAEREWGFGQVVAMVLLGTMVLTIADAVSDLMEQGAPREQIEMGRVSLNAECVADKQSTVVPVTSQTSDEDISRRVDN
ncbi:hypothetical protein DE146DRAFT_1630 [Phaeosphaeria sp. MPI-PUGE-AT-0046c]|nr:hypothetical protein DE146DRAFT_1630 [Phaeosphaeria sp. MPI-PUGE-AT-0046c]